MSSTTQATPTSIPSPTPHLFHKPTFSTGPGPFFLGVIFNVAFYGVLVAQMVDFQLANRRDRPWLKILILVLFILSTCDTVIDLHNCYFYLILPPPPPPKDFIHLRMPWTSTASSLILILIIDTTKFFFCYRIKRLSGANWVVALTLTLTGLEALTGLSATIANSALYLVQLTKMRPVMILWFVLAVVSDVVIAAALIACLSSNRTGVRSTDALINKIILSQSIPTLSDTLDVTIQTNVVTSVVTTTAALLYVISPKSTVSIMFILPYCPLYLNALMSTLNARQRWDPQLSSRQADKAISGLSGIASDGSTRLSTIVFRDDAKDNITTELGIAEVVNRGSGLAEIGNDNTTPTTKLIIQPTLASYPHHPAQPTTPPAPTAIVNSSETNQDDEIGSIQFRRHSSDDEDEGDVESVASSRYRSILMP